MPVIVEIGKGTAAMRALALKVCTGIQRDIAKAAATRVEEQTVRLAIGLLVIQFLVVVDVRIDGEEVFEAIVVKVEEAQPPAAAFDGLGAQPARPRLIRK